jgi:hypothetical protein
MSQLKMRLSSFQYLLLFSSVKKVAKKSRRVSGKHIVAKICFQRVKSEVLRVGGGAAQWDGGIV